MEHGWMIKLAMRGSGDGNRAREGYLGAAWGD